MSASTDESAFASTPAVRWDWGLDVLLSIVILALLNLFAAQAFQIAAFKAKSTEQLMAGEPLRLKVGEHFALTGDWNITESERLRERLRGPVLAGSNASMSPSQGTSAGIVDGVVITLGDYPGDFDQVARVTHRPAVATSQEKPTVIWICGHAPTPAGMEGPRASPAANLPETHLFSMCRKRAAP